MKVTADNVTDAQIESLLGEAANYGDEAQVDLCNMALREPYDAESRYQVRSARIKCARVIDDAMAMESDIDATLARGEEGCYQ